MSEAHGLRALPVWACAVASLAAATLFAAPAAARSGFPAIRIASEQSWPMDPEMTALLAKLRELVAEHDLAGVTAHVSEAFRWDRDFGSGYEPEVGAAENFVTALRLDDSQLAEAYRGVGWRRLGAMLEARSMGAGGARGEICAPAEPRFRSRKDQERAYTTDGLHYEFGYVEATGVAIRAAPTLDATVLDRASEEVVRIPDWAPALEDGKDWIEVETARGARGHMATRFVESFVADRICFGRDKTGAWAITAYVGGGD